MKKCCTDNKGEQYGWGKVLDYLKIPWRDPKHWYLDPYGKRTPGQMTIFDYVEGDTNE